MTQEDKELLKKDLCARLPYRVKVYNTTFKEPTIQTLYGKISDDEFLMEETYTSVGVDGDDFGSFNKRHYTGYVDFIKPYLRPISSMTRKERYEIQGIIGKDVEILDDFINIVDSSRKRFSFLELQAVFNWLNKKMFDYCGLIDKGLAIEAPKGMYK